MTTIAWDGISVAADSLETADDRCRYITGHPKIMRDIIGYTFGFIGDIGVEQKWVEWFKQGSDPFNTPYTRYREGHGDQNEIMEGAMIVFAKNKQAVQFLYRYAFPVYIAAPDAFGTGAAYAIGALDAGKTAREAVDIASRRTIHSGGETVVIEL